MTWLLPNHPRLMKTQQCRWPESTGIVMNKWENRKHFYFVVASNISLIFRNSSVHSRYISCQSYNTAFKVLCQSAKAYDQVMSSTPLLTYWLRPGSYASMLHSIGMVTGGFEHSRICTVQVCTHLLENTFKPCSLPSTTEWVSNVEWPRIFLAL